MKKEIHLKNFDIADDSVLSKQGFEEKFVRGALADFVPYMDVYHTLENPRQDKFENESVEHTEVLEQWQTLQNWLVSNFMKYDVCEDTDLGLIYKLQQVLESFKQDESEDEPMEHTEILEQGQILQNSFVLDFLKHIVSDFIKNNVHKNTNLGLIYKSLLQMEAKENSNDILNNFFENPHKSTIFFKNSLEKTCIDYVKEIKDAVNNNAKVIHIKDTDNKNYDVLTPYNGELEVTGIENLICHMYGVIGVINSLPILYKDEDKNIIRAVAPRHNSYNERSSQSPFNDLDWHVDAAYRPMFEKANNLSPIVDYLVFGIVHKGHENLPIIYVGLEDILNQLSHNDILAGLSKEFTITSADSFSHKISSHNMPLLVEHSSGYYSRIKLDAIPETQKAQNFLNNIREIVDQKLIQNHVYVNPGDIVILSNKAVLHKRDKYTPKWDGKDRYFIRMYAVKEANIKQGILANSIKPWIWT